LSGETNKFLRKKKVKILKLNSCFGGFSNILNSKYFIVIVIEKTNRKE